MNPLDHDLDNSDGNPDDRINAAFGSLHHDATQLNPPGVPTSGGGMTTALPVLLLVALLAGVGGFLALRGGNDSTVVGNDPESAAVATPDILPQPTVTTTPTNADDEAAGTGTPITDPSSEASNDSIDETATTGASIASTPTDEGSENAEATPAPDPGLTANPGSGSDMASEDLVIDVTPMAVIGVAADDVLNARGEPGVDAEPLGTIPPFSTGVTRYSDETVIGDSTWVLTGNPDARDFDAWVNDRFLTEITGDSDQPRSFYNAVSNVREALSLNNSDERLADVLAGNGAGPVVISADGYFDDDDQRLSADDLSGQGSPNPTIVRWGYQDGSGDPIDASVEQFFDQLAATPALTQTEQVGVNQRIHYGNLIDNAAEFFPGATIVELHYGGDEGDLEAFTWDTIRLAFQPAGDTWHLVGIAHDTWTI